MFHNIFFQLFYFILLLLYENSAATYMVDVEQLRGFLCRQDFSAGFLLFVFSVGYIACKIAEKAK